MKLKVEELRGGLHPSEVLIVVRTSEGKSEQLIIDRSVLDANSVDVGNPIARNADTALVELPRETMRGEWRVWVGLDQLEQVAR